MPLFQHFLPKQVIIWEEKPTGLEGCTSTPLCLSGPAAEGLEIFSEHISSSMLEISATSTMVRLNRMKKTLFSSYKSKKESCSVFIHSEALCLLHVLVPVENLLLLTYIFDRLAVVYLTLSIISSTTCRKKSQECKGCVCE